MRFTFTPTTHIVVEKIQDVISSIAGAQNRDADIYRKRRARQQIRAWCQQKQEKQVPQLYQAKIREQFQKKREAKKKKVEEISRKKKQLRSKKKEKKRLLKNKNLNEQFNQLDQQPQHSPQIPNQLQTDNLKRPHTQQINNLDIFLIQ